MSFLGLRCSGTQFENLLGPRGSQMTTGWKEALKPIPSTFVSLFSFSLTHSQGVQVLYLAFLHAQPGMVGLQMVLTTSHSPDFSSPWAATSSRVLYFQPHPQGKCYGVETLGSPRQTRNNGPNTIQLWHCASVFLVPWYRWQALRQIK